MQCVYREKRERESVLQYVVVGTTPIVVVGRMWLFENACSSLSLEE